MAKARIVYLCHKVLFLDMFCLCYLFMIYCQVCYSTQVYWPYLPTMLSASVLQDLTLPVFCFKTTLKNWLIGASSGSWPSTLIYTYSLCTVTRNLNHGIIGNYKIGGKILNGVEIHCNLGVLMSDTASFSNHIHAQVNKAYKNARFHSPHYQLEQNVITNSEIPLCGSSTLSP